MVHSRSLRLIVVLVVVAIDKGCELLLPAPLCAELHHWECWRLRERGWECRTPSDFFSVAFFFLVHLRVVGTYEKTAHTQR